MFKVKVENLNQLEISLSSKKVSEIILSRDSFAERDLPKLVDKIKKSSKSAWILMERISRYEENMKCAGANFRSPRRGELCEPNDLRLSTDKVFEIQNLDGIIIQNLDSFAYMLRRINKAINTSIKVELNYTMNCYNDATKKVLENLYNEKRNNAKDVPLLFTAPVELNTYELSEVGYDTMIVYSYIDTMVSANCLRKNTENTKCVVANAKTIDANAKIVGSKFSSLRNGESRRDGYHPPNRVAELSEPACKYRFNFDNVQDFSSYIIDRKGKKLHYKTYCKYCYNKIFNTEPLFLLDKIEEIQKFNIVGANANIVGATHREPSFRIDFSFENEKEVKEILSMKCPESFTRGHYKNSIK